MNMLGCAAFACSIPYNIFDLVACDPIAQVSFGSSVATSHTSMPGEVRFASIARRRMTDRVESHGFKFNSTAIAILMLPSFIEVLSKLKKTPPNRKRILLA